MSGKYKRICKDCRLSFMANSFELHCEKCNGKLLDKILEETHRPSVVFVKEIR